MTGGLRDLVESNRDVLTLQKELPFPGIEQPLIAEPNNRFVKDELDFIEQTGLIEPNNLLKLEKEKLNFLEKNVTEKRNEISRKIGNFKKKKDKKESDFMENQSNLKVRDILNRYLETIKNVSAVSQYTKKGIRS